jgi:HAD superfamily hydrolase (TIGR01549 family)
VIKGAVFDLDGTLVHLPLNYDTLHKELCRLLKTTETKPITEAIHKLNDKQRRAIYQVWTRLELEALPNLKTNHEGIKIYTKFSNKPSALITLQGKEVVKRIMAMMKLSFSVIITREDNFDRVEQLKMAVEKLGLTAQDVLMVGDRESDKKAAQKLGCQFLMVQDHAKAEHLLTQNFK